MMDAIKKGVAPKEAYEKNIGTYGRFKAKTARSSGSIRASSNRRM